MAYGNLLASVPPDQIAAYRQLTLFKLSPSSLIITTHALVTMTEHEELRATVEVVLDGGEEFDGALWHPLRSPRLHFPESVPVIAGRLKASLAALLPTLPEQDRQWYEMDFGPIVSLLEHAAKSGEAVISALELPFDAERANRVTIPFDYPK